MRTSGAIHGGRGHRRRGLTLLEMMASLTTLLMIGVMAATLLNRVTGIGLQVERSRQSRAGAVRLATAFRKDVSESSAVTVAADGRSVTVTLPDSEAIYFWDDGPGAVGTDAVGPNTIGRRVTSTGDAARLDRFRLPSDADPQCQVKDGLVALRLGLPGRPNPWNIEAPLP